MQLASTHRQLCRGFSNTKDDHRNDDETTDDMVRRSCHVFESLSSKLLPDSTQLSRRSRGRCPRTGLLAYAYGLPTDTQLIDAPARGADERTSKPACVMFVTCKMFAAAATPFVVTTTAMSPAATGGTSKE